MIVSKNNLKMLIDELIAQIIIRGIEKGWPLGGYKVECFQYDEAYNFDVLVGHPNDKGVDLCLSHKGKTIGIIKVKDTIIFSRTSMATELARWREQTATYLTHQLSKFLVEKFVDESPEVGGFFKNSMDAGCGGLIHISGIRFGAMVRDKSGWFFVKQGSHTLLHIERTNALGMTTAQGWQAMNGNTIISEFRRSLVALIDGYDSFKFSVQL